MKSYLSSILFNWGASSERSERVENINSLFKNEDTTPLFLVFTKNARISIFGK